MRAILSATLASAELATSAPYQPWRQLRATDRRRYNAEKKRIRDRLLELVEERYVPGLAGTWRCG